MLKHVLREEKKFLIGIEEVIRQSHKLDQVMIPDPHNETTGYIVRSLYFDTPFDDDFEEKLAGVELRRKIRLRIYDPSDQVAKLEMKQKQGARQLKRSLTVSRADAERLIQGDLSPLLSYSEPFAAEMHAYMQMKCYRPKTIVEYKRKAYIARENNIRVTFDSLVESTESSFDLFSEKLNMNYVLDQYDVVMEVKFNGFLLEYIRGLINSIDRSEMSVSKYVLARQNAYRTHI